MPIARASAQGVLDQLAGRGELAGVDAGGDVDGEHDGLATARALQGGVGEGEGEGGEHEQAHEALQGDLPAGQVDQGAAGDDDEVGE